MDPRATSLLSAQGGVAGWHQLERLGLSPSEVGAWVRSRHLVRVRRGAYAAPEVWDAAAPSERYRLTVRAVLHGRGDGAASRHSALAAWGLPLWDVDRRMVVVVADVEETTTRAGVRVTPRRALLSTSTVDGLPVESVPDALVTTASTSVVGGVVAADAALQRGLCRVGDLHEAAERLAPSLRGRRRVRQALANVDPRCESPGESRTRLLLTGVGLPVTSQVAIHDHGGRFVARVDFLVAGRVVVEFDGALKYGADGGREALVAEKWREDRLRALGYVVIRVTWSELERPDQLLHRIRSALARAAA